MELPRIRIVVKNARFTYLWCKYVVGARFNVHCARCLLGEFASHLPKGATSRSGTEYQFTLDEHPAKYVYLCGTTGVWADNVHVAMRPEVGGSVRFETPDILVECWGMVQVPIQPIRERLRLGSEFTTCRNYQFAWQYFDGPRSAVGRRAAQVLLF